MSTDNVTPIQPPTDGRKPARKAPKHSVAILTFRTEAEHADVSAVLAALRFQFEAIQAAIEMERPGAAFATSGSMRAFYLAISGAAAVQGLIERMDAEEGP